MEKIIEFLICVYIIVAALFFDIKSGKIPFFIVISGAVFSVIYQLMFDNIFSAFFGGIPGIIFIIMAFLSKESIEYGDCGIIFSVGICISIGYIMQVIMISFLLCFIFGIIISINKGKNKKRRIKYTPFFSFAVIIVLGGKFIA